MTEKRESTVKAGSTGLIRKNSLVSGPREPWQSKSLKSCLKLERRKWGLLLLGLQGSSEAMGSKNSSATLVTNQP